MSDQEYGFGFDLPGSVSSDEGFINREGPGEDLEDDFWGTAFDENEVDEVLKRDLPPEGWYTGTLPNQEERQNKFEPRPELAASGRLRHFSGATATVYLNLCPKKYYGQSGKVGFDYLKYKEVMESYVANEGTKPTSGKEFKRYLANHDLAYRLVHQTNGKGMKVMEVRTVASAVERGYLQTQVVNEEASF